MALYLVRHGQTEYNEQQKMQGQTNSLLNQEGQNQARLIGKKLENMNFAKIYTSDLKRAYDTAKIMNEYLKLEIIKDLGLREIHLGLFEGKTMDEVKIAHQDILMQYDEMNFDFDLHQGESLNQFNKRIITTFKAIASKHFNEDVIVVTHRGFIQILLCTLLQIDFNKRNEFIIDNGSISVISYNNDLDNFECIILNDIRHLETHHSQGDGND
jgi:broad specificity phosphatase PhoE